MTWGIQTWDANGVPNNYGIKPVSVVGRVALAVGQTSGAYSFTVPPGFKVGFAVTLEQGTYAAVGRRIQASGNTITILSASESGAGNYPANACELVIFMEKS
ncbi:TPA: hypothetical protein OUE56_001961 [Citrobacter sedlakii]|nr:hypothetical protein [Citrobacter sedlakii]